MSNGIYDLAIVGAGSAGLTAAGFAARLGARVALIEKRRIGGDCTWTGCVPSKALLRAARAAHEVRSAARYGIVASAPVADMRRVRDYVRGAIQQVYGFERPEDLERQGIEVVAGAARFLSPDAVSIGERTLHAKNFLIATGAHPALPPIAGLADVPFLTYEQIFEIDRLPETMTIVGGGPVGMEMAQAFQRLGSNVTLVAKHLLPKEDPEARDVMRRVFEREGVRLLPEHAASVRRDGNRIVVDAGRESAAGELLLISAGRKPSLDGLDLAKAGVAFDERGIVVDNHLRTGSRNIYAAGDVVGGPQFTHLAAWQAFQAVRNALLPGSSAGFTDLVPRVTFTDPEVAHAGLTEAQAREKFGDGVEIRRWEMSHADRAICEGDTDGFIKLAMRKDGTILGATIVAARAGEAIAELALAIKQGLKAGDIAGTIHAYPTYSTAAQQLAAEFAIEGTLSGASGAILRGVSKLIR